MQVIFGKSSMVVRLLHWFYLPSSSRAAGRSRTPSVGDPPDPRRRSRCQSCGSACPTASPPAAYPSRSSHGTTG
uniref:Putative secreted protein n=1 Tax=Anopheles darlingi TaxID=43151 RepID=A0A2M4DEG4_ANODA